MPTKIRKDFFCSLWPCRGPVKTRAKDAKRLFPPIMASWVNGPAVLNLVIQFFTLDGSKIEVFETPFFLFLIL